MKHLEKGHYLPEILVHGNLNCSVIGDEINLHPYSGLWSLPIQVCEQLKLFNDLYLNCSILLMSQKLLKY